MYRLIKSKDNAVEVLMVGDVESEMLDSLVSYVRVHATNGDEYNPNDMAEVREDGSERIGDYVVSVDEVDTMTAQEIVEGGGAVCAYCHSDDVDAGSFVVEDGYVSRELICNICDKKTMEEYNLVGIL